MTQITIEKGKDFDKTIIRIANFTKNIKPVIIEELEDTAIAIRNRIIRSMDDSPKTGRKYRRGRSGKIHTASSPSFAPRPDSGALKNSIKMDARGGLLGNFEVEVGSNIKNSKYPVYVEEGTKNMEPRPYVAPAAKKELRGLQDRIMKAIDNIK